MLANAFRRSLQLNEKVVVPRISDLQYILAALYGKLEFEVFDESEEDAVVTKLINYGRKKRLGSCVRLGRNGSDDGVFREH